MASKISHTTRGRSMFELDAEAIRKTNEYERLMSAGDCTEAEVIAHIQFMYPRGLQLHLQRTDGRTRKLIHGWCSRVATGSGGNNE